MDVGSRGAIAAGCLALIALTAGCLPHGPLDANLFSCLPKCDGGNCSSGDCCDSRAGEHGRDSSADEAGPAANPAMMAPYSSYHPVPTRPVFTPWALQDPPQDSGTLTTWSKGLNRLPRRPMDSPYDQSPSDTTIAREPRFTTPASATPTQSSDGDGVTRAAATGWHSAS